MAVGRLGISGATNPTAAWLCGFLRRREEVLSKGFPEGGNQLLRDGIDGFEGPRAPGGPEESLPVRLAQRRRGGLQEHGPAPDRSAAAQGLGGHPVVRQQAGGVQRFPNDGVAEFPDREQGGIAGMGRITRELHRDDGGRLFRRRDIPTVGAEAADGEDDPAGSRSRSR